MWMDTFQSTNSFVKKGSPPFSLTSHFTILYKLQTDNGNPPTLVPRSHHCLCSHTSAALIDWRRRRQCILPPAVSPSKQGHYPTIMSATNLHAGMVALLPHSLSDSRFIFFHVHSDICHAGICLFPQIMGSIPLQNVTNKMQFPRCDK